MDTSNNDDASNEHTLSLYDIETLPGNSSCVDCNVGEAEWASLGFGVLICLNCAGHHRSLGVHISLVRSLNLDSWSTAQLSCLRHGGNDNFRAHLSSCFSSSSSSSGFRSENQRDIFESRYSNPEVLYYKEILLARIENREPEEYNAADFEDQILNTSLSSCKRDDMALGQSQSGPTWGADKDILECLICKLPFSFLMRRHHCRRCGKCVCSKCAPAKNSRPIMEWGLKDSVRHCKLCYMSPIIKWSKIHGTQSSCSPPITSATPDTPR